GGPARRVGRGDRPRDGRAARHDRGGVAVRPDPGLDRRVAALHAVTDGPGAHERLEGPVVAKPAARRAAAPGAARGILAVATPSSSLAQDATLSRSRSRVRIPPGSPQTYVTAPRARVPRRSRVR